MELKPLLKINTKKTQFWTIQLPPLWNNKKLDTLPINSKRLLKEFNKYWMLLSYKEEVIYHSKTLEEISE
jgi:hypothetical protein